LIIVIFLGILERSVVVIQVPRVEEGAKEVMEAKGLPGKSMVAQRNFMVT
jgi:hypothetical protein